MRVVLDSNVVVSAAISPNSPPALIHRLWDQDAFDLLVSPALLAEYRRVLAYDRVRARHRKSDELIEDLLSVYVQGSILIHPEIRLDVVIDDPDDDRILECAIAGTATHIVTGDSHLLQLSHYEEISIVTPRAFLEMVRSQL